MMPRRPPPRCSRAARVLVGKATYRVARGKGEDAEAADTARRPGRGRGAVGEFVGAPGADIGGRGRRKSHETTIHQKMLALLVAAPSASLVASSSVASRPFLPANGAARAAMLQLCQPLPDTPADQVIDELLAESKPEALPALLGRRLDVLTDAGFLPRLEARRSASVAEYEQLQLEQLADLVVTFLEEVAERVQELEPKLAAANEEAEASIAEAAQQAQTARMDSTGMPARRARSSAGPSPTTSSSPPAARDGPEGDDDEEKREQRARNRFMVERLLDAANAGGDRLDTMLSENRDRLDASFFAHLQWEVEEQKQMKNRKLLAVLETLLIGLYVH